VAVEILAGTVVTHRGARFSVAGGNLDIAQVHPGVETGREQCSNPAEYPPSARATEMRSSSLMLFMAALDASGFHLVQRHWMQCPCTWYCRVMTSQVSGNS
jgi:hypothetical protein